MHPEVKKLRAIIATARAALTREELGKLYEVQFGYDLALDDPGLSADDIREILIGVLAGDCLASGFDPSAVGLLPAEISAMG